MAVSWRSFALLAALALTAAACSGGPTEDVQAAPDDSVVDEETSDEVAGDLDSADSGVGETVPPVVEPPASFAPLNEPGVGGRITSIAFDPTNPDRVLVGGDLLGIAVTDDFGQSWLPTTGLVSWEIGDITTTPSADGRIWTGSLSGPQSSLDGITWELARNGMPAISESQYSLAIETVLVDPTDNSRLLAFNGNQRNWTAPGALSPTSGVWDGDGSVWQSRDSGQSWTQLAVVADGGNIRSASFNSDNSLLYAAVGELGVFVSNDDGSTWTPSNEGLPHTNPYDITAHPTDPLVAWVAMGEGPEVDGNFVAGGIWRTLDGGATWQPVNDGLNIVSNATAFNTGSFHQIVVAPSSPGRLFTSNIAPGQAAVYRSDDGGDSWTVIADETTQRPNAYESALRAFDIGVHPSDADRVVIGSDDTLLGTRDGGATWTDLTTAEAETGFFTGRGYSGLVSTDIAFNPDDPDDMILLGFDGGNFIQTVDGGESWRRTVQDVSPWGGAIEAVYSPNDPDRIYVLLGQFRDFRGIGISEDGGATFSLTVGADFGLPESGDILSAAGDVAGATGLAVRSVNGTDEVYAAVGGQLYRSSDAGATFTAAELASVRDVAADEASVYVTTTSGFFSLDPDSQDFTPVSAPDGLSTLYTSNSEPGVVYAVAFREGDGGAYRFDGTTWEQVFDDFFSHGVAIDPTNPNNIAVVTTEPQFNDISSATGVHLSNDGGQTWTAVTTGLPMNRLRTAEFDPSNPDRLVVGTTGRGFYDISFAQALASAG